MKVSLEGFFDRGRIFFMHGDRKVETQDEYNRVPDGARLQLVFVFDFDGRGDIEEEMGYFTKTKDNDRPGLSEVVGFVEGVLRKAFPRSIIYKKDKYHHIKLEIFTYKPHMNPEKKITIKCSPNKIEMSKEEHIYKNREREGRKEYPPQTLFLTGLSKEKVLSEKALIDYINKKEESDAKG